MALLQRNDVLRPIQPRLRAGQRAPAPPSWARYHHGSKQAWKLQRRSLYCGNLPSAAPHSRLPLATTRYLSRRRELPHHRPVGDRHVRAMRRRDATCRVNALVDASTTTTETTTTLQAQSVDNLTRRRPTRDHDHRDDDDRSVDDDRSADDGSADDRSADDGSADDRRADDRSADDRSGAPPAGTTALTALAPRRQRISLRIALLRCPRHVHPRAARKLGCGMISACNRPTRSRHVGRNATSASCRR